MNDIFKLFDKIKILKNGDGKNNDLFLKEKEKEKERCCIYTFFVTNHYTGESICKNCGIVTKGIGSTASEEGEMTGSENIINPLLPKLSMVSSISGNKHTKLQKIHLWTKMPNDERSLWEVSKKINDICFDTNLPKYIINETKFYYKKISESEETDDKVLTRGNIRIGLILACVYFACKNNNIAHKPNEIAKMCNVDLSIITKGIKKFNNIEKMNNLNISDRSNSNDIHIYIERYSKSLGISSEEREIIHLIYERAVILKIIKTGAISTTCAGIIYVFVIHEKKINITKKDIISEIKVSEVTLNKIFNILMMQEKLLFTGLA